jgi:hypothetical protein
MRTTLTTTALALTLLVSGVGWAQAQTSDSSSGGGNAGSSSAGSSSSESGEQGGLTGSMTTTPRDKSDDAAGTRGETMGAPAPGTPTTGCQPGQTPAPGQTC